MAITKAQYGFYYTLKTYHRAYPSEFVLTKIVSYIGGEVVANLNSADYTIYVDSCPLFTGTYGQLLDCLFDYIFDEDVNRSV